MTATAIAGQGACLCAAALWAVSLVWFRPLIERHGARAVNLAKCALACAMLAVTVAVAGGFGGLAAAPAHDLALVALSGIVGLALGDTALFGAVKRLGTYRTLLLQNLAPAFAAAVAWGWLGRAPQPLAALGAAVTLSGVVLVVAGRRERPDAPRPAALWGFALALGAAFSQGAGIVLAKEGMHTLGSLSAALLRLAAGVGVLLVLAVPGGTALGGAARLFTEAGDRRRTMTATVLGTYLAFIAMMFGVRNAPEAVAATLLATTPVFSLALGVATGEDRPTSRGLAGALLAVAGVAIMSAA